MDGDVTDAVTGTTKHDRHEVNRAGITNIWFRLSFGSW